MFLNYEETVKLGLPLLVIFTGLMIQLQTCVYTGNSMMVKKRTANGN